MHQTRKGQQWYFGMKLHIGVDSQSGLAHSAVVTAANVHDKHPLPDLLHGNERRVYGDSAYASQKALIASKAPKAKDFTNQRTRRAGGWTKFSGPRTATNRGCVPGSSMSLRWSSACGDSPRCAIAQTAKNATCVPLVTVASICPGRARQGAPVRVRRAQNSKQALIGQAQCFAGHLAFKWLYDG